MKPSGKPGRTGYVCAVRKGITGTAVFFVRVMCLLFIASAVTGAGTRYKDGVYSGEDAFISVNVEIKGGDISLPYCGDISFSYSVVDFMVQKYGFEKVIALLDASSAFEDIIGISLENFEIDWINFLKENYLC